MQEIPALPFPRIAIVGGGPGGLMLARTLFTRGIPATVFERDESPLARPQGGTLDLHADGGQLALRRAGLEAEFLSIARYEDQGSRLYDKHAALIFDEVDAPDNERPEVDRTELRRVLLESVPPEMIRWNHKLKAIWQQDGGAWELVFENGERGVFDLVVGADGAWSKVRPLVSDAQPIYSGFTFVEFGIDDVDRSHPEIAALVGRGKIFALGDSKGLICQRNSNSHFRVYAALPMSENPDECSLDLSSPAQAKASLLSYYAGWSPKLLALIWSSAEWMSPRPLYSLPIGHSWQSVRGLTLLGDAAHLMSPFGGEGVNLAMRDASDLAHALADALEAGSDWHAAVAGYEKVICERASEPAAGALEGLNATMSENAIESVLAHMQSHYPQPA